MSIRLSNRPYLHKDDISIRDIVLPPFLCLTPFFLFFSLLIEIGVKMCQDKVHLKDFLSA